MASASLPAATRQSLASFVADLRRIFGVRLLSVSVYDTGRASDDETRTIVLVDRLTFDDLAACAPLARQWRSGGLAVPLLLEEHEFRRTLDVFPLEYGEILAHHTIIEGMDPFAGLTVGAADRRRACELHAKSHLIHLREGYLESAGDPRTVARLIAASADRFRQLLENLVLLVEGQGTAHDQHDLPEAADALLGVPADLTREVLAAGSSDGPSSIADPTAILERYVAAVDRIWEFVDEWRR
jgi:hypothetical protein